MSIYQELAYDRVIAPVGGLQFCILSDDEIRRRSVCEVSLNKTFDSNEPVTGGLFDPRMGTVDNSRVCTTCHQRNTFCPGHFGHISLERPVFYIQFFDTVRKLLRCVCYRCSRLLVDPEGPEVQAVLARKMSNQRRWEAISKLCQKQKTRRCGQDSRDGCGARQPDAVVRTNDIRIAMIWRGDLGGQPGAAASGAPAGGEDNDEAAAGAVEADSADVVGEVLALTGGGGSGQPNSGSSSVREVVLSAEDVLRILRRVSDADSCALGLVPPFNRPERMICTVLPVPPPAVRPSVRHDTGQRQEDDLTHMLSDIIKFNNLLRDAIAKGSPAKTLEYHVVMLQYHVAMLVDNSVRSLHPTKDRSGRVMRSITDRLKHKEGRIRGNLMGKRVDFSARTVITPDPNLSIDELGVPLRIAMNLTFPEVVNEHNRDRLLRLVLSGPDTYPGAKHVRKTSENNRTIRLKGHPDLASIVLKDGDVVERHLVDGDYVLFNRQPSLHKMSMMAHRVRVMEYNTFRLNVCVCASYNADFDGDEMNMHVPQSLQTHYELKQLAAVPLHVLSPRHSTPIITIVQDVALGVFRMTQGDVRIRQQQVFNLVCSNPLLDPAALPAPSVVTDEGGPMWTGRQVMSTVLPAAVAVRMPASGDVDRSAPEYKPEDDEVVIEGGAIRSGVLSAYVFKKESRGLVHSAYNTLGPAAVTTMLNNTQKMTCDYLVLSGFSVGVSDVIAPSANVKAVRSHLDEAKAQAYELLQKVHAGTFENVSTKNDADFLEETLMGILGRGSDKAGKACAAGLNARNNRMLNMILSGSKGGTTNFTQMVACLGSQSIEQRRVKDGFDHRTLPHFCKYDDGPEARGFVEHSFIEGLTPHEFFFHSMAGRIGLIDTAVRSVTRETPIIIMEDGAAKYVQIGDWIDAHLEARAADVQHYPEDRSLELLKMSSGCVLIPTVDEAGNVTWGELTAVTRHDPGERLYKVTTESGRQVTVAESQSLLVWDKTQQKILPKASPDVKVSDQVPIASSVLQPSVTKTHIDVSMYLSKKDHLYGTDFHAANKLYLAAQDERRAQGKTRVLPGWWEANNSVHFELPYATIQRFNRAVSGRSEMENVKEGFVYPFHATRCHGHMPAEFDLTLENGIFIGIYLADGHTCEKSGCVGITKNNQAVRDWVEAWFKKYEIKTYLADNSTDVGTSLTLHGHSTLLARFLDRLVGRTCYHKHVPDEAFSAPEEFVVGILSGYFSGDGSVEVQRKQVTSWTTSERLNNGIAFLCARLGIFASTRHVPNPTPSGLAKTAHAKWSIRVRGVDGARLAAKLQLIEPRKAEALRMMTFNKAYVKYEKVSDVTLDPIKEIEVIGVDGHPKLYDVTVPSTLNFVLASGLCVRDTSETGYLQRRLVKAMEDCKIQHDFTVRNANGFIVQFLYGEDGMDAVKLEFQKLPYLGKSPAEMRGPYLIACAEDLAGHVTPEVYGRLSADEASWRPQLEAHFGQLLEDRRSVIMGLCGGLSDELSIVYPVHVARIVDTAADLSSSVGRMKGALSDLHPLDVLTEVGRLCEELRMRGPQAGSQDIEDGPQWMPILLRCFLSPKQLIVTHKLSAVAFRQVIRMVREGFFGAIASPGEMVGIVAAQSIGEPTTQLTLNTFHLTGAASATNVTAGVPRMRELMSMSRRIKTPEMRIHLRPEWASSMERAKDVLASIQTTLFKDLVRTSAIYYDPDDRDTKVPQDRGLLQFYREYAEEVGGECASGAQTSPWVLRFEFDRIKMLDLQVTMLDVECVLNDFYSSSVSCVLSDDNSESLVCRLRLTLDGAGDGGQDSPDLLTEIKALEQSIMEKLVIKGVSGINKAILQKPNTAFRRYDPLTDTFVADDAWSIVTDGSNILDVFANDRVDPSRTKSNDVYEVYQHLGIEAGRACLISELRLVLRELKLDYRHLSLLGDVMCNRGFFMSIDRHGIRHGELGPLAKCSFEQTDAMLIKAGIFAERDRINGVSANIMLGQVAPCGTGDCDVLLDNDLFARKAAPVSVPGDAQAEAAGQQSSGNVAAMAPAPLLDASGPGSSGTSRRANVEADDLEFT